MHLNITTELKNILIKGTSKNYLKRTKWVCVYLQF